MVNKEYINPPNVYGAPWKFNQAIKARVGDASLVFISGIVARQDDGDTLGGDIVGQMELACQNLQKIIEATGGTMNDIVNTNWFIGEDFRVHRDELREVGDRYFPTDYPTNTLMQVAGFANPDYMFEIDAIAVIHED